LGLKAALPDFCVVCAARLFVRAGIAGGLLVIG